MVPNPDGQQYGPQAQQPYGPQAGYGPPYGSRTGQPPRPAQGRPGWLIPVAVVAGVVVLLAAVGGFLIIRSGGGGGDSAAGASLTGKTWNTAIEPASPATMDQGALGSWLANGLVVFADRNHIVALDQKTGQQRWELKPSPLPNAQGATHFCGMSTEVAKGVGAVTFGVARTNAQARGETIAECNGVALVDVSTGRQRWAVAIPNDGSSRSPGAAHPEVVGDTAIVSWVGAMIGFAVSDGTVRWQHPSWPKEVGDGHCFLKDLLPTPTRAVGLYTCTRTAPAVVQVDPASGSFVTRGDIPAEFKVGTSSMDSLVSAAPVVVLLAASDREKADGSYVVLDDALKVRTRITQQGSFGQLNMDSTRIGIVDHLRYSIVVSGDTLVTNTAARQASSSRDTNNVVAFNLSNGKLRWSKNLNPKSKAVPVGVTKDGVIGILTGNYESPPQLFRMAMADGSASAMGPAYSRDLIDSPGRSTLYWEGNKAYGVTLSALKPLNKPFTVYCLQ